jgi:DeoR/GlpR family transcriptional regulator of sugar metabolism
MERRRAIITMVQRQGDLTVEEACRVLGISPATARRDFAILANRGAVQKTWGGLRKSTGTESAANDMLPSSVRESLHPREKERIARAACDDIADGDVLVIDGGTTTLCMAPHLANRPVRIITNSILIAHRIDSLRSRPNGAEVFLTGGFLYPGSGLLVGPEAVQSLNRYHAEWAFLSVGGLDCEGGTNTNHLVVESERKMISMAEKVIVLSDSSKWNSKEMVRAFRWSEVDRFVTDTSPPTNCKLPGNILVHTVPALPLSGPTTLC